MYTCLHAHRHALLYELLFHVLLLLKEVRQPLKWLLPFRCLLGVQANDIVLCDGPCNRAYHFLCVRPPLRAEDLTEDEGWLCPACDAKVCPMRLHLAVFHAACGPYISPHGVQSCGSHLRRHAMAA